MINQDIIGTISVHKSLAKIAPEFSFANHSDVQSTNKLDACHHKLQQLNHSKDHFVKTDTITYLRADTLQTTLANIHLALLTYGFTEESIFDAISSASRETDLFNNS